MTIPSCAEKWQACAQTGRCGAANTRCSGGLQSFRATDFPRLEGMRRRVVSDHAKPAATVRQPRLDADDALTNRLRGSRSNDYNIRKPCERTEVNTFAPAMFQIPEARPLPPLLAVPVSVSRAAPRPANTIPATCVILTVLSCPLIALPHLGHPGVFQLVLYGAPTLTPPHLC